MDKLQKKAVRIICMSSYDAHTAPLFKSLNLLTVLDLFKNNALKFTFKYHKGTLPLYFDGMLDRVEADHDHDTRYQNLRLNQPKKVSTEKCLRFYVPKLLAETPDSITDKFFTHSPHGFNVYVKNYFIQNMTIACMIPNCFVCRNQT